MDAFDDEELFPSDLSNYLETAADELERKCVQPSTIQQYHSKMYTATRIMEHNLIFFSDDPFLRDTNGALQFYNNTKVYKIKLPMPTANIQNLFSLICHHPDLLKRGKNRNYAINTGDNFAPGDILSLTALAKDIPTISINCAIGFQAALRYYECI